MVEAKQAPADVRVRLLGRFELTCDGTVAIDAAWKPAKAAAIVKILALRPGRSMHRDQLIAALWPDSDAEAGTNSLYKSLHQLRQTVRRAGGPRDVIHLEHPSISLAPYVRLDLDEFGKLIQAGEAAASIEALASALAAGGEPLLPDDLYEPWTEPYRSDHQLLTTRMRLQLARMHLDAGAVDASIEQYSAVLASDDLSEAGHAGLMRAYSATGQRDLALRQYERCKEVLASELGAVPSPETEALAARIREGDERTRTAEAIDAHVRAGDAAMRQYAYAEAIEQYREAIARLGAVKGDGAREAEVWLKLAIATSGIGSQEEIAECCRRSARLAERAGAYELLARSLVQFQAASDSAPGNHAGQRESAELIEGALARLPDEERAARAMLLAASARPLAAGARSENEQYITGRLSIAGVPQPEIEARLREAVAIARTLDRPELLAMTLTRLRTYITSPDTLDERLALTAEMIALTKDAPIPVSEFEAQLFRHEDLLEAGDIEGARIQARNMRRLADSINSSGMLAAAFSLLATHDTADGPLADAARTLRRSREEDEKQGNTANSRLRFGSQLLALRWHQGRVGEMEPGFRRTLDVFPRMTNVRAALAFIYGETGELERARAELAALTEQPRESISRDYAWWFTVVFMSYASIATDAKDTARSLYAMIEPFGQRNANSAGGISFGSAALVLALLADFLDDRAAAETHFEKALAFNIRTRQGVWIARTRHHYAEMLLRRADPADEARARELARVALADAHEMGMTALVAKLSAPPFAATVE